MDPQKAIGLTLIACGVVIILVGFSLAGNEDTLYNVKNGLMGLAAIGFGMLVYNKKPNKK